MTDSGSYAARGQRAAAQRHRWMRANEHVVASNVRGGGATARRQSENDMRLSQARPGRRSVIWESRESVIWLSRRRVRMECRRLGQDSARDLNMSRAGPGATDLARSGHAPLARAGSTRKNRWI